MSVAPTRREARERAVELLYEAESKAVTPAEVVANLPIPPDPYAAELVTGVGDHLEEIDHLLGRFAQRWPVSRMAALDRAVLRLGTFELATQAEVPTGAALSEAVELGSRYGSTDDTSRFVNGILGNVAKHVRGPGAWRPVEVLVLDMDGVVRHWDDDRLGPIEADLGLPQGAIAEAAFAHDDFRAVTVGQITAEDWAGNIGRRLGEAHGVDPERMAQMWLASEWRIDDEVVALTRAVRDAGGSRVALFSNATDRLQADLERSDVADLFGHVANSALIEMAKPDVAAFERVSADLGVVPSRLLFVDDRPENVVGALDAGWHAVRFRSAERLRAVLRRLGVAGA